MKSNEEQHHSSKLTIEEGKLGDHAAGAAAFRQYYHPVKITFPAFAINDNTLSSWDGLVDGGYGNIFRDDDEDTPVVLIDENFDS